MRSYSGRIFTSSAAGTPPPPPTRARARDERRRALEIAALLDRLTEVGDAGVARLGASQLETGGAIQRLGGGFGRARLGGGQLEHGGDAVAFGDVALLLREARDPREHVERARLHLLGAAVQVERADLVAEVVFGDARRQQQECARDAHVRLAPA